MLSVVAITLSFIFFGVVHSFTASLTLKSWVKKWSPAWYDRWYRLAYSILSGLTLLPAMATTLFLPDQLLYKIPFPWVILTGIIQLIGLGIAGYSLLITRMSGFVGLKQAMQPDAQETAEPLITHGSFRYVRHPIYAGSFLVIWLLPIMTLNFLTAIFCATLYIVIGIYFEEKKLVIQYGQPYIDYKNRTPMLFPWKIG